MWSFISNLIIILIIGIVWFFLLYRLGKRAAPKHPIEAIETARIFMPIGYIFVIAVITISYLFGFDMGSINSIAELFLLIFIVIPIFFIFCYLLGCLQFYTILNSSLYKYYKENKIVEERELQEKIKKAVKRWAFFHYCLSFWRKNSISDVLKQVCPSN